MKFCILKITELHYHNLITSYCYSLHYWTEHLCNLSALHWIWIPKIVIFVCRNRQAESLFLYRVKELPYVSLKYSRPVKQLKQPVKNSEIVVFYCVCSTKLCVLSLILNVLWYQSRFFNFCKLLFCNFHDCTSICQVCL